MTETAETAETAASNVTDEVRNEVIITVNGRDIRIPMDSLGLEINSPDRDILTAVRPVIQGREGLDIQDDGGALPNSRKGMSQVTDERSNEKTTSNEKELLAKVVLGS